MNSNALIYSDANKLMESPLYNKMAYLNRNTTFFLYENSFLDRLGDGVLKADWLKEQVDVYRIHSYLGEGENSKLHFFAENIAIKMWIGEFDYFLGFSEAHSQILLENWSHVSIL